MNMYNVINVVNEINVAVEPGILKEEFRYNGFHDIV